jgi:hypothetical protein
MISGTIANASMMDDFIDPQDGMLDASHWLAERKGFFPIPIIITEPAVGFGLGAGLIFLHDPLAGKTADGETFDPQNIDQKGRMIPPSVSGLFGKTTSIATLAHWQRPHLTSSFMAWMAAMAPQATAWALISSPPFFFSN